jgi:hypothetical protein
LSRVGTDESGYSLESGVLSVQVRAWGFWDVPLAASFAGAVVDALRAAGPRVALRIVATDLKPQGEAGEAAFRALIAAATKLGLDGAELVVGNAITKLQLARIVREVGARSWMITTGSPRGG